jgi:major membrane immunogen (membrane-anchored lipoprotein)
MRTMLVIVVLLSSCSEKDFVLSPEDRFKQDPTLENCMNNGGREYHLRPKDERGPECVWRSRS